MTGEPAPWKLERFIEAIDEWIKRESPTDDMQLIVLDWVMGRTTIRTAACGVPIIRTSGSDRSAARRREQRP